MEIKRGTEIISKELYPVFMFKTKNNTTGYINRDYNAVLNMKYIVETLIETKKRPEEFIYEQKRSATEMSKTQSEQKPTALKRVHIDIWGELYI